MPSLTSKAERAGWTGHGPLWACSGVVLPLVFSVVIAGIWGYFALSREPPPLAFALIAVILALLVFRRDSSAAWPRRYFYWCLSDFRWRRSGAEWVSAPTIRAPTGEVMLSGVVENFEIRGPKRAVAILRILCAGGTGRHASPSRARLTLTGASGLRPGQIIKAKAQLFPLSLSRPVPDGYDYGRSLWFDGIGATGRIYGDILVEGMDPSWLLRLEAGLQDLRDAIGRHIRAVLPAERSGVGEAMITGARGTIPPDVNNSLQVSGLSHILSIFRSPYGARRRRFLLAGAGTAGVVAGPRHVLSDQEMGGPCRAADGVRLYDSPAQRSRRSAPTSCWR